MQFRKESKINEMREKKWVRNSLVEFLQSPQWSMTSSEVYAPQTDYLIVIILQARGELILLHSRWVLYINFKVKFILPLFLAVVFKFFPVLEQLLGRLVYILVGKTQNVEEWLWRVLDPVYPNCVKILTCGLLCGGNNAAFIFSHLCFS